MRVEDASAGTAGDPSPEVSPADGLPRRRRGPAPPAHC